MDVVVVVIFWSEQSMEMMLSQGRMDQSWQCCNDQYVNTDKKSLCNNHLLFSMAPPACSSL